jgi:hypothetical protein
MDRHVEWLKNAIKEHVVQIMDINTIIKLIGTEKFVLPLTHLIIIHK